MTITSNTKEKNLRKERNSDVIRRMKNGDQLSSFNSYSSWFPPRPIIEKDAKAVKELYGKEPKPIKEVRVDTQKNSQPASRPLRLA
jgi:hypothetical protein